MSKPRVPFQIEFIETRAVPAVLIGAGGHNVSLTAGRDSFLAGRTNDLRIREVL